MERNIEKNTIIGDLNSRTANEGAKQTEENPTGERNSVDDFSTNTEGNRMIEWLYGNDMYVLNGSIDGTEKANIHT